jgi:hypothetical protein
MAIKGTVEQKTTETKKEEFQILPYSETPPLRPGDQIEIVNVHPSVPIGIAWPTPYGARLLRKKKIVIGCPKCHVQCSDIKMKKKSDGNYWTDDTCWNCGEKLPAVRLE